MVFEVNGVFVIYLVDIIISDYINLFNLTDIFRHGMKFPTRILNNMC